MDVPFLFCNDCSCRWSVAIAFRLQSCFGRIILGARMRSTIAICRNSLSASVLFWTAKQSPEQRAARLREVAIAFRLQSCFGPTALTWSRLSTASKSRNSLSASVLFWTPAAPPCTPSTAARVAIAFRLQSCFGRWFFPGWENPLQISRRNSLSASVLFWTHDSGADLLRRCRGSQ